MAEPYCSCPLSVSGTPVLFSSAGLASLCTLIAVCLRLSVSPLSVCCRYLRMDEAAAESELGVDFTRDLVTAEMRVGSVLLLNNLIPHR